MKTSQVALLWMFWACASASEAPQVTAFVDVNVVPMDRERVMLHQTVLTRGNRIEAVGAVKDIPVPPEAQRVEGRGTAWLMPGMADMHTHIEQSDDAALYVAYGVTTVMQMGGDRRLQMRTIRSLIDSGTIVGPQVLFGMKVDGGDTPYDGWPVDSAESARVVVRAAKAGGYDFIKVYHLLTPAEFDAILDEARKVDLPVVGHGVRSVGLPQSLFQGQVMVAHAEEFYYTSFGYKPDVGAISAVVRATRDSGAWVTANLSAIQVMAEQWGKPEKVEQYLRDPLSAPMAIESRILWARKDYARRKGSLGPMPEFLRTFTKALANGGVPLLAGTDSPVIPGLVPGYSINIELHTLTDVGLTPFQALSAATRNAGDFVAKNFRGAMPFGTVAPGMRADLLLVAANPLQTMKTLETPLGVMSAGRWRSAEELRAVLAANIAARAALQRQVQ